MKYKYVTAYYEVTLPDGNVETRQYYSEYARKVNESEMRRDVQFGVYETIKYHKERGEIIAGNLLAIYPSNSAYPIVTKYQSFPLGGEV